MASQGKRMVPEALIKKLQDFSNNGLAALTAGNITTLTTNQINSLKCGDIVCKEDSTGKHAYIVSYKKDGTGICLTYADASVVETVSYDYSGSAWVYNSTDITPIKNVVANPTLAGTEANLTGLQVGDTKYAMPHLYRYEIRFGAELGDKGTTFVLTFYSSNPNIVEDDLSTPDIINLYKYNHLSDYSNDGENTSYTITSFDTNDGNVGIIDVVNGDNWWTYSNLTITKYTIF